MRSWKVRVMMVLAMMAMVLAFSIPAMAQVLGTIGDDALLFQVNEFEIDETDIEECPDDEDEECLIVELDDEGDDIFLAEEDTEVELVEEGEEEEESADDGECGVESSDFPFCIFDEEETSEETVVEEEATVEEAVV